MNMFIIASIAIVGTAFSAPALAQAGGPDLPGGAKTTSRNGMSTSMPKQNMKKMTMSHKGTMMRTHKTM